MEREPADRHFGQKATWLNKSFKTFSIYAPEFIPLSVFQKLFNDWMLSSQVSESCFVNSRKSAICLFKDFKSDALIEKVSNLPIVCWNKI